MMTKTLLLFLVQFLKAATEQGSVTSVGLHPLGRGVSFCFKQPFLIRKVPSGMLALFKMEIPAAPGLSLRPASAARRLQTSSHSRLPDAGRRA